MVRNTMTRSNMPKQDRDHLATLRAKLLDHPIYGEVGSVADLRRFIEGDSPQRHERALRAACKSIEARIELWNGTLGKLRDLRPVGARPDRAVLGI
jgi:hypothetical protein